MTKRTSEPSGATSNPPPPRMGKIRKMFEGEGRVVRGELVDQGTGQGVEARADPIAFSPPLSAEQPSGKSAVMGFLTAEKLPPTHVTELEHSKFGEGQSNVAHAFRLDPDSIQGRLVGVECDQRGRNTGFGRHLSVHHHNFADSNVDLGYSTTRVGEHSAMIGGYRDGNRSPLAPTEGETQLPSIDVEMEGLLRDPDERRSNEGNSALQPVTEPVAVSAGERTGDFRGGHPDGPGNVTVQRSGARKPGDLSLGGDPRAKEFSNAFIDQESKVSHERKNGWGKVGWRCNGTRLRTWCRSPSRSEWKQAGR